jgi:hypothetical protein
MSAGRASVARTEHHLLGGNRDTRLVRTTVDEGEPHRRAAKQGIVWGNEKVKWSGAGGKDDVRELRGGR